MLHRTTVLYSRISRLKSPLVKFYTQFKSEGLFGFSLMRLDLNSMRSSIASSSFSTKSSSNNIILSDQDFVKKSNEVIEECNKIRSNLIKLNPLINTSQVLMLLDKISNQICSVIDAAEMCRNLHTKAFCRDQANEAFSILSTYIQELNTDKAIYNILSTISDSPDTMSKLSHEERLLIQDLKLELERDGIHLSEENREIVRGLSSQVVNYETEYLKNLSDDCEVFEIGPFPIDYAERLKAWLQQIVPQSEVVDKPGYAICSSNKRVAASLLRQVHEESIRKQIYLFSGKYPSKNREALSGLVRTRQALASHLGYKSFVDKYLTNKVLKSPNEVQQLLHKTSKAIQPKVSREVEELLNIKRMLAKHQLNAQAIVNTSESENVQLHPWDINYLIEIANSSEQKNKQNIMSNIAEYFTIENSVESLIQLCKILFGIIFTKVPLSKKEIWAEDIIKYEVTDSNHNPIGTVYLDLFHRENKFPNAAHFTVQCGCLNSDDIKAGYQLPVVALAFNIFPNQVTGIFGRENKMNSIVSFSELQVIYHEWGHALHSLLSRTSFQHLSGTRGSTDFVEVPSHLFEFFATCPEILTSWAKHYKTNQPLSKDLVLEAQRTRQKFSGIELQTQLMYSCVDQFIFGNSLVDLTNKSDQEVYKLIDEGIQAIQSNILNCNYVNMNILSHSHLTNYGAGYYSYLFARMYAAQIWEKRFALNPLSRDQGRVLSEEFLRYGAAKDPKDLLNHIACGELDPLYLLKGIK